MERPSLPPALNLDGVRATITTTMTATSGGCPHAAAAAAAAAAGGCPHARRLFSSSPDADEALSRRKPLTVNVPQSPRLAEAIWSRIQGNQASPRRQSNLSPRVHQSLHSDSPIHSPRLTSKYKRDLDELGVVVVDSFHRIVHANNAANDILQYEPSELVGRDLAILMPPLVQHQHSSFVRRYEKTERAHVVGHSRIFSMVCANGQSRLVSLTVSVMKLTEGSSYYMGCFSVVKARIPDPVRFARNGAPPLSPRKAIIAAGIKNATDTTGRPKEQHQQQQQQQLLNKDMLDIVIYSSNGRIKECKMDPNLEGQSILSMIPEFPIDLLSSVAHGLVIERFPAQRVFPEESPVEVSVFPTSSPNEFFVSVRVVARDRMTMFSVTRDYDVHECCESLPHFLGSYKKNIESNTRVASFLPDFEARYPMNSGVGTTKSTVMELRRPGGRSSTVLVQVHPYLVSDSLNSPDSFDGRSMSSSLGRNSIFSNSGSLDQLPVVHDDFEDLMYLVFMIPLTTNEQIELKNASKQPSRLSMSSNINGNGNSSDPRGSPTGSAISPFLMRQILHRNEMGSSSSGLSPSRKRSSLSYDTASCFEAMPSAMSKILSQYTNCGPWANRNVVGAYMMHRTLGSGTFGKVFEGVHAFSRTRVAVKALPVKKAEVGQVMQEIDILRMLQHPNVVRLYEVVDATWRVYLIMEYVENDLKRHMQKFKVLPEAEARYIFVQILLAVAQCHSMNIIHRDLKSENVLLTENGRVKVADFGLSQFSSPESWQNTFCGTLSHVAPEILKEKPHNGPELDVWSLGVILYEMVTGTLPFRNIEATLSGKYKAADNVSESCRDLIKCMLCTKVPERATIRDILHHPWVQESLPKSLAEQVKETLRRVRRPHRGLGSPSSKVREAMFQDRSRLDMEALHKVVALGFDRSFVAACIMDDSCFNSITAMYYLFVDKAAAERSKQRRRAKNRNSGSSIDDGDDEFPYANRFNYFSLPVAVGSLSVPFISDITANSAVEEDDDSTFSGSGEDERSRSFRHIGVFDSEEEGG